MILTWKGTRCSDGCPFYQPTVSKDPKSNQVFRVSCTLHGRQNADGAIMDIQLTAVLDREDGLLAYPAGDCPFLHQDMVAIYYLR